MKIKKVQVGDGYYFFITIVVRRRKTDWFGKRMLSFQWACSNLSILELPRESGEPEQTPQGRGCSNTESPRKKLPIWTEDRPLPASQNRGTFLIPSPSQKSLSVCQANDHWSHKKLSWILSSVWERITVWSAWMLRDSTANIMLQRKVIS